MKERKNCFENFANRINCIFTAYRIERQRTQEQRLRAKLSTLEGDAARKLLYRMRERHLRADALEIRYARLTENAKNPERLAI